MEKYYQWKEWDDLTKTYIIPWSNPYEYEYPFDFIFNTIEEAYREKNENAPEETWTLCYVKTTKVNPIKLWLYNYYRKYKNEKIFMGKRV